VRSNSDIVCLTTSRHGEFLGSIVRNGWLSFVIASCKYVILTMLRMCFDQLRASAQRRAGFCTQLGDVTRVCVVGTGPGGFYTAKYLLKEHSDIHVDLIDALPTPFGERINLSLRLGAFPRNYRRWVQA
jgi:hypothetical protein